MENANDQETIDSKYIILDKKGHGATANVYLVKKADEPDIYAAKVLKKRSDLFDKEINILNTLRAANNPNIVNIISSGEGYGYIDGIIQPIGDYEIEYQYTK